MNRIFRFLPFCLLLVSASPVSAGLDIVVSNPGNDEPVYVLKNLSTGKVLGTFWDRAKDSSDFGFESSIVPDFFWSKERDYVAVSGGASRSRAVSLYKVAGNTLKEIAVPQLTEEQAAPINKIPNTSADGTDAVRWQSDGTLLLRFWAAGRVTDDSEKPKEANVWADLEVNGLTARIVGTSDQEPSANPGPPPPGPVAEEDAKSGGDKHPQDGPEVFDPKRLAGKHSVTGRNPDGSAYKGTVKISVVKGLVGLEWTIGESVSHGSGLLVGSTLGVALDSGIAIYQIHGRAEGLSLIGKWSSAGSQDTNDEAIWIGQADMPQAKASNPKINGTYHSLREVADGQVEGTVIISGGPVSKKVVWKSGGKSSECQALALNDGLAVLSPGGLSVFSKKGDSLEGSFVGGKGGISQESLVPVN